MHVDIEQWDSLVGELYDTMLRPDLLQATVTNANALLASDLCHIVGLTARGTETLRVITRENSAGMGDLYASYYAGIDPRRKFMESAPVGHTYRCASFFDDKFVANSEFYQDFLIPHGFRYVIGACLHRSADQQIFVAFNHGVARADFSDAEQVFFRMYNHHLVKVIGGMLHHAGVAQALACGHALNALQAGVLGIRADGKLAFCNAVAEKLFGQVMAQEVVKGALSEVGSLLSACKKVMADGQADTVVIRSGTGAPPVYATVCRLTRDAARTQSGFDELARTACLVILSLGRHKAMAPPSQLIALYGLTPAEARLAHQLGRGLSIKQYAAHFHVSVATVRTQLRALLRKTGEAHQQDLVQTLSALPIGLNG